MKFVKRIGTAVKSALSSFVTSLLKNYLIREADLRREFDGELQKLRAQITDCQVDISQLNGGKFGKAIALKSAKS